ncbi:MAG: protein kinase [bacterium]|nr:protein kinase [bacterium]
MIGQRIHNYDVVEKTGEGGMGVVYKAHDVQLKRTVALKFLPVHLLPDEIAKERFLQEARAAAALNHPNIITVYQVNEYEGQLYIAMELVDGCTLRDKISKASETGKRPAVNEIIDIALQICEGLEQAHQKGIIHRDIKPRNIMINTDKRVKILDFGTAKLKTVKKLTQDYHLMGTLHYMSPELLNYEEPDQRTDIWALGIVLFEMLTGALPFDGDTAQEIFNAVLKKEPGKISAPDSDIPGALETVVRKALAKDRNLRYADISALAQELKAVKQEMTRALDSGPTEHESRPTVVLPAVKEQTDPQVVSTDTAISIAVLPFKDLSRERDLEYFCEGIAEDLINVLTKIKRLKVATRTSAFRFKEADAIEDIAGKLGVRYILEGSVQKSMEKLRITTKLVHTEDGCLVWSERFDCTTTDIFAIQDEITLAVVRNLEVKLLKGSGESLGKRHTADQEAYKLYLKGRYFWNRRYEGGLNTSIRFYQESIEKDESYARPYVGIADSLNILGLYGFMPPGDAFNKAQKAAQKALALDNELPQALASLGWINNFYSWDWEEAEKNYRRAIEISPDYATAHEWYALSMATRGQMDGAFDKIKKALDLDPLSLIINSVHGVIYLFSERFDEAEEQFRKTLEMDPNFLLAHIWLGEALSFQKKYDEAIQWFEKAMGLSSGMSYIYSNLGFTYAVSGKRDKAKEVIAELREIGRGKYLSPVQEAQVHVGLGDMDRAFELLEKAYLIRDPFCIWFNASAHFNVLRKEQRFEALLKSIGLKPCSA